MKLNLSDYAENNDEREIYESLETLIETFSDRHKIEFAKDLANLIIIFAMEEGYMSSN